MIIQKNLPKSVNLQAFITTYHPSSSVFMTNKTPSGAEKHHWTRKLKNGQNVLFFLSSFFFLLSSSDGLAQYCVNFSWWFTHKTAAFYTEQCTTLSLFHNFEVSQGAHNHSLKTMASSLGRHFLYMYFNITWTHLYSHWELWRFSFQTF